MKNLFMTAAFVVAGTASSLQAQPIRMRAEIPFDFQIGKVRMPAGQYYVTTETNGTVLIRQQNGRYKSALSLTKPAGSRMKSWDTMLVFNHYEDSYFLSSVWTGGPANEGRLLPQSPAEKEIAARLRYLQTAGIPLQRQ